MSVSPNPTPAVFAVFDLPAPERWEQLRALLDQGADPNAVDPRLNRFESLLGRAFREPEVDPALVELLLERGANPLRAKTWVAETGEMEALIPREAFLAMESGEPPSHDAAISPHPSPQRMRALLKACHTHDHRDDIGHDALVNIVLSMRTYSHMQFVQPLRDCLALGFPINQPLHPHPNAVHYLLSTHASSIAQPHWVWDVVAELIDAGADMHAKDREGITGWERVDRMSSRAWGVPSYDRIQADRQGVLLQQDTAPSPSARPRQRI